MSALPASLGSPREQPNAWSTAGGAGAEPGQEGGPRPGWRQSWAGVDRVARGAWLPASSNSDLAWTRLRLPQTPPRCIGAGRRLGPSGLCPSRSSLQLRLRLLLSPEPGEGRRPRRPCVSQRGRVRGRRASVPRLLRTVTAAPPACYEPSHAGPCPSAPSLPQAHPDPAGHGSDASVAHCAQR